MEKGISDAAGALRRRNPRDGRLTFRFFLGPDGDVWVALHLSGWLGAAPLAGGNPIVAQLGDVHPRSRLAAITSDRERSLVAVLTVRTSPNPVEDTSEARSWRIGTEELQVTEIPCANVDLQRTHLLLGGADSVCSVSPVRLVSLGSRGWTVSPHPTDPAAFLRFGLDRDGRLLCSTGSFVYRLDGATWTKLGETVPHLLWLAGAGDGSIVALTWEGGRSARPGMRVVSGAC